MVTEATWLAANNPYAMIRLVAERVSPRKIRLFSVARCRRMWDQITDERCRNAVMVGERYADGAADASDLELADQGLTQSLHEFLGTVDERNEYARLVATCRTTVLPDESRATGGNAKMELAGEWHAFHARVTSEDAPTVRDIVGNPFRPPVFDPLWRSETALALAAGIYAERAFDRLPILADALEDAGCEDTDILGHCRGPGPHVRGCWVVDLLLGKA